MPSLRSIFTLQDNYSRSMDRIWSSTQRTTNGIGQASAAVDNVNSRFTAAEGSANRLTSRLTGLAAAFLSIETVKKGMDISDTYTNTASKLSLITQSASQLKSLQNDIFSAADRARGSYTDMADTVGKLGIIAMPQFGNANNIVKFTETMQKMFKIGGTSTANQSGAMLQLQQAIGSGRLQGQDLRILAEDAPMVELAIAKYMKKSTGDIRQLGTEGKITSQVLINSILQYSGTVDSQMGKMSYTWGDYWNKIKNGAYQAFGGVFASETGVLGSQKFKSMIDGIVGSFSTLANVANQVLTGISNVGGFIADNWSIIVPILLGAVGVFAAMQLPILAAAAATVWKTICDWAETAAIFAMIAAQDGLNAALAACPITWIIAAIIIAIALVYVIIAAVNKFTNQSISATGIIVGALATAGAFIGDLFIGLVNFGIRALAAVWNYIAALAEFFANVFNDPVGSIVRLFSSMASAILQVLSGIASAIDAVFGSKMSGSLDSLDKSLQKWTDQTVGKAKITVPRMDASKMQLQRFTYSGAWDTGYKAGQSIDNFAKNALGSIGKLTGGSTSSTKPIPVTGTGADGSVKVNIADQDLQYLRDLAEKQYVNKFSTAVLSPKLSVQFTGNAGDKDNQQQIYSTIGKMLREELATAAEGIYP